MSTHVCVLGVLCFDLFVLFCKCNLKVTRQWYISYFIYMTELLWSKVEIMVIAITVVFIIIPISGASKQILLLLFYMFIGVICQWIIFVKFLMPQVFAYSQRLAVNVWWFSNSDMWVGTAIGAHHSFSIKNVIVIPCVELVTDSSIN